MNDDLRLPRQYGRRIIPSTGEIVEPPPRCVACDLWEDFKSTLPCPVHGL